MDKLKEEVIKDILKRHEEIKNKLQTEEGLKLLSSQYGKTYKKNPKEKLLKFFENRFNKEKEEKLNKISSVKNSKDFNGDFIITLEWKKSYMWGSNPRAYTNYGFIGESIGGCGYCKTSTATAQALNSNLSILKLLYSKENERLNELQKSKMSKEDKEKFLSRRAYLNYGSGYGVLPRFEGGVGVSSHESILKNLGLIMLSITDTNNTNVYLIRKMNEEELNQYTKRGY
jgi:hypothetical protein